MSGHGWVRPNANGIKARCGGPGICAECAQELSEMPGQQYTTVYGEPMGGGTDIHGTNWAEYQRVFKIERDSADNRIAHLHFSVALKDGEIASLLEHLRSWHP